MNTKQLEYFVKTSQYNSINQAAAACYISQPSLNYSLTALENELGVKLLKRSNNGVTLTKDGERFLRDAKSILSIIEPWYHSASGKTIIYLFSIGYISDYMIPYLISQCKNLSSEFELKIESNLIYRKKINDACPDPDRIQLCFDFILKENSEMLLETLQKNGWAYKILGSGMSYVFFHKDNPILQKESITMEDLSENCVFAYYGEYDRLKNDLMQNIIDRIPQDRLQYTASREATFRLIEMSPETITVGSFPSAESIVTNASRNIIARQINGISSSLLMIALYPSNVSEKFIAPIIKQAKLFLNNQAIYNIP